MFRTAPFITAKTWKQPRCPQEVNGYLAVEYYTVLERNELSHCKETWKRLKCILLSDRGQYESATYDSNCMAFSKRLNSGDIKRSVAARDRGGRDV